MNTSKMALAVAKKELIDHSRDRRSVASAFLMPLFGPVVLAAVFTMLARTVSTQKVLDLPVVGPENAPNLVAFLERSGVKTRPAPSDYEQKIQDGDIDAVLVVPPDYAKSFTSGRPAEVRVVLDSSRSHARVGQERVRRLLERYAGTIGAARLVARGITPDLAVPLKVEDEDLATPEKQGASLLSMIPMFLVLAGFVGGMNVAIDVTAGERERGSLEPLLLNPVSRAAVVVGKWLATMSASLSAVVMTELTFAGVIRFVPLQDLGVKAQFGVHELVGILLGIAPLALLASALQMLVATYARSYKEAQTYLQLFTFLPTLPAMVLAFEPVKTRAWMMLVPMLGQNLLVTEVLRGERVPATWFLLAAVSAVVVLTVALAATTRLFGREKIVFGR